MKRVILFAVAVLMVCAAKAQFSAGDFIYGGKVGLNVTNISNMEAKAKASIHIGAFAEWKMNDFIGISPEFVYSRQGAVNKEEEAVYKEDGVKMKFRVNYLNIPILAKLYVLENLSVDLGPQFGFAMNGKWVAKEDGTTLKDKEENLNTFDVSFPVGLSYIYDNFIVSARYNIGLTNVLDKDNWGVNTKNGVFQFSIGYCLNDLF